MTGDLVSDADLQRGRCGQGYHDLRFFEKEADGRACSKPGACIGSIEDDRMEELATGEDSYQGNVVFCRDRCDLAGECIHKWESLGLAKSKFLQDGGGCGGAEECGEFFSACVAFCVGQQDISLLQGLV